MLRSIAQRSMGAAVLALLCSCPPSKRFPQLSFTTVSVTGDVVFLGPTGEPVPSGLDSSATIAVTGVIDEVSLLLGETRQIKSPRSTDWGGEFDRSGHFELQFRSLSRRSFATSMFVTFTATVPGSVEGSLSWTIILPTVGSAPLPTFTFTAGSTVAFPAVSQTVPIPGVHIDIADGPSGVSPGVTFPLKVGEYQVTASIPGTALSLTQTVVVQPGTPTSVPFEFGILPPGAIPGTLVPFGGDARQFLFQGDKAFTLSPDGVFQFSLPDRTRLHLSTSQRTFGQTLALDEAYVYWSAGSGGRVYRVPIGGGPITSLASWPGVPTRLLVDSTSAYCAEISGAITKIDKAGSLPVTIARGGANPQSFVQDEENLYWTAAAGVGNDLLTVPKIGGDPITLASNATPPLAVDGGRLFWSNASGVFVRSLGTSTDTAIPGTEDVFGFELHGEQFDWVRSDGTLLTQPLNGGTIVTLGQLPPKSSFAFHNGTYFISGEDRGSIMFTPVP